jgi:hypothetical protein
MTLAYRSNALHRLLRGLLVLDCLQIRRCDQSAERQDGDQKDGPTSGDAGSYKALGYVVNRVRSLRSDA